MNVESASCQSLSHRSPIHYLRYVIQEHLRQLLKNHLELPHLVNQANQHAIAAGHLSWQNIEAMSRHFFRQMQLFPGLSGIQWGTREGEYLGILDLGNRTPTLELKQAPLGRHKQVFALDDQGQPTPTCLGVTYEYDPRVRPWYVAATLGDRPSWSPVYQYSSNASVQLAVMATLPLYDAAGKAGVVGCDVAFTHLSQVLADLSRRMPGTYCLLERNGYLIASSAHPRPFAIEYGRAVRLTPATCGCPIIATAIAHITAQVGDVAAIDRLHQWQCQVNGDGYLLDVQPLPPEWGLDWLSVTCLPLAELSALITQPAAVAPSLAQQPSLPRAASLQEQVRQHAIALAASQQALAQSEERWLLALQGTNDGLWDWHLDTNEVFFSERWQQISGYQPGELAHHFEEWKQRIHPADLSRVMAALQAHLQGQTDYYAIEHRTQCKDGSYKWVLDRGRALWDATQRPTRMVGSRSDITERKAMEARLIFQSDHDALTGLINRAALLRQIQQLIEQPNCHFVLLFIDLDRFQSVNNSLGHATGDQLIMEFAQALRALVGSQDAIARLSGDEFVVLLKQTLMPPPAIAHLVERIQGALQQLASCLNLCTPISVSVGITSSQQSPGTPQDILRDADIAMHAAKYGGGNQFVAFSPTLREQSHKHLMLESALKQAVERQEFVLHFQPVMCLDPLHPVGIEALVRWQHPERGCISPYEFIPVAEKTGLILPLGQWILERACQHLKHWQTHYPCFAPITLNINVSIQQFYQPGFVATLDRLLATYQIAPTSLRLEITESCLMERTDLAIQTMNALHERQIALCIDDFGTGYSSLSYLHNLPVESLKIDQSFVSRIVHSNQGIAMIKAILAMSQSLGMKVVAEGIETHQQLAKLQELGCRFGQGYLFSQPCDAAAIHHWLHHFSQARCLAEPPQP